jgi:Tfp pilus assembly protein PilN
MLNDASLAAGSNPEWSNLLITIGNSVPESLILKNIEMKYSDPEGKCSIKGAGQSHKSVSEWLKKLEEVKGIDKIKCELSSSENQQSRAVNFEIEFSIQKGPGYKLPEEVSVNE